VEQGSGIPLHFLILPGHPRFGVPMTDDLRRDKPLVKCPHAACDRGDKKCQKHNFNGECAKTHFASLDEWIKSVASWMTRIRHDIVTDPTMNDADYEAYQDLYAALAERIEIGISAHLLSDQNYVR
jgi:hypothetical protein